MKIPSSPLLSSALLSFVLLSAMLGCDSARAQAPAPPVAETVPAPATAAGQQLDAWLQAFNSGERSVLLDYHERSFPYAAASNDVSNIDNELGLRQGTGGFQLRRIEQSSNERLVALLQERNRPQYARVTLRVSPEPPQVVSKFVIGPVPTPFDLLPLAAREARTIDAAIRHAALDSIGRQLEAHYVYAETAAIVVAGLQRKQARGDYDALTDAVEFADVIGRELWRLARDKHLSFRFEPQPPPQQLAADTPAALERSGYGFGPIARLEGNVAQLVLNGFPPPVEAEQVAIAERMSQIADADVAIVDLRNNNGGSPATVLRVASYFFDSEPVHLGGIYRRDTDVTEELWTASELSGSRFGSQKPVYILTGPSTFSGGEGLAYELQAQGRAVVVGEGTGGGAHPTGPYRVDGGFVLNVPWGRSVNPITGTNWEGIGVVPDVFVAADDALETAHQLALERLGQKN
ncbi:MAG: hypothetical protein RL033_6017 [Pseudomonadota bacterium]|jgi:hypothetical protein